MEVAMRNSIPPAFAFLLVLSSSIFSHAGESVDQARLGLIAVRMQQFVDDGRMAGAVFLLAQDGQIVLHEAVGYDDLESRKPWRRMRCSSWRP